MKLGVGWGGNGIEHTIVRGGLHYLGLGPQKLKSLIGPK